MRIFLAALLAVLLASRASAETGEVRLAIGFGLVYLPFTVMEHEQLLEKQVEAAGLPRPTVTWNQFSGGDMMNQALLSGTVDIVNTGSPAFLTIWAKTRGSLDVRAIAAYNELPLTLVSRNPDVHTIADFTEEDRIALPAVKQSTQAIVLQIAAERLFGEGQYDRLDHLTIGRSHADATVAMLSGSSEITAHFTVPPFADRQLREPGFHVVLTESEVFGGPLTGGLSYTTAAFREQNPLTYNAYLAALTESIALINSDPEAVAAMYLESAGGNETVEDIVAQLSAPGMNFSTTPQNIGTVAEFMARIGSIEVRPDGWQDLFFPEIHSLPGS